MTLTHRKTPPLCHFLAKVQAFEVQLACLLSSRVRCRVNTGPAERCVTLSSLALPSVSMTEDSLIVMLNENESQGDVSEEDSGMYLRLRGMLRG